MIKHINVLLQDVMINTI